MPEVMRSLAFLVDHLALRAEGQAMDRDGRARRLGLPRALLANTGKSESPRHRLLLKLLHAANWRAIMTSRGNLIPAGYPGATPYLTLRDAAAAIDFYCQVFGASETMRVAITAQQLGSSGQRAAV